MSFLDDEIIQGTQDEIAKKEQEWGGDKREKMSPGSYKLFLCKIELDNDANNVAVVKVTSNIDADQKTFKDLTKIFRFDENDQEKLSMNKKMFIEFFYKSFGHKFAAGDLKAVVNQVKKYEGKKFSATVQVKQRLMAKKVKDDEGKDTSEIRGYMIVDVPQIYFVGKESEDLTLKPERKFVKIKEQEIEVYEDHKKEYPDRYDETGRLKFEDSAEGNSEAKSPESAAEQAFGEAPSKEKDDDLPW